MGAVSSERIAGWPCRQEAGSSDVDALVASYNQAPLQERKVYIACMHLSQIHITVSFLPAELQRHHSLTPDDITGAAPRCAAAALRVLLPHGVAIYSAEGVG